MTEFKLTTLVVGSLETNCYILTASDSALIIDPGAEGSKILAVLNQQNAKPHFVLNTHGHADHIGANSSLADAGAEIYIHAADSKMLEKPELNLSIYTDSPLITGPKATGFLAEGQIFKWLDFNLEIIHTPGHTQGGVCILVNDYLFTGDTLFAGGIGRSDLPGGNASQLINSIKTKIFSLPQHLTVLPGHGPSSTVGHEQVSNPYVLS